MVRVNHVFRSIVASVREPPATTNTQASQHRQTLLRYPQGESSPRGRQCRDVVCVWTLVLAEMKVQSTKSCTLDRRACGPGVPIPKERGVTDLCPLKKEMIKLNVTF